MSSQVQLIVGLGNPGQQYARTRHNVGAWCLDGILADHQQVFKLDSRRKAGVAKLQIDSIALHCMIPTTFMNESGYSVASVAKFYKIAPENILVVHDDLDFAPGLVRFKIGGGHGGHNGLRDIIRCLGSQSFQRLRIGIGHPGSQDQVSGYVLSAPSEAERIKIHSAIEEAKQQLVSLIHGDHQAVYRQLHQTGEVSC